MKLSKKILFIIASFGLFAVLLLFSLFSGNSINNLNEEMNNISYELSYIKHINTRYKLGTDNKKRFDSFLNQQNAAPYISGSRETPNSKEISMRALPYASIDRFVKNLFNQNFEITHFEIERADDHHANLTIKIKL